VPRTAKARTAKGASRVYLIDASIYVFRAWFTLPESITDSQGRPANAVYGWANFLIGLLESVRPQYIACAFDESLTTSFRNDLYPQYKSNREEAPRELKEQFRLCRQVARALGVADYADARYEADDIIGTLAHRLRPKGLRMVIVSGDKDLAQVVRPGDTWWNYARETQLDYKGVTRHLGVPPERIPDLLALAGDPVDNIPGVPGIGLKTAARLVSRFGGVEELVRSADAVARMDMRGAARASALLREHADAARLARRLTEVSRHAPVRADLRRLAWKGAQAPRCRELFARLDLGEHRRRRWLELAPPRS
jgi:5'-3' exonuclease